MGIRIFTHREHDHLFCYDDQQVSTRMRDQELHLGFGTEFRSETILRNRLGIVSVIPRKKVLIPRYSEFRGRANSEARNGTNGAEFREKMKFYGTE